MISIKIIGCGWDKWGVIALLQSVKRAGRVLYFVVGAKTDLNYFNVIFTSCMNLNLKGKKVPSVCVCVCE